MTNITVSFDDISLDDTVHDERGSITLAGLLVREALDRLIKDHPEDWRTMAGDVLAIRSEVIREHVTPLVAEALARPLVRTNQFGEATGGETTLTEVVIAEAKKVMSAPAERHGGSSQTVLQRMVADEIRKQAGDVIATAVKEVKEQFAADIAGKVRVAIASQLR